MKTLIGLLALILSSPAWAAEPTPPTAPTAVEMTVAASPLSTVNVTSGDAADLKSKIEAITTCGVDVVIPVATYTLTTPITLPAVAGDCLGGSGGRTAITGTSGAHAVAGSGGLSAAVTSAGDNYIIIRSANNGSLSAGRPALAEASNMPTILTSASVNGAFLVADNAHHFKFDGLNVTSSGNRTSGLFFLQGPTNTIATQPHHLIVNRTFAHPDTVYGSIQGIQAAGKHIAITNSRVYDIFHNSISGAVESHGILFASGQGPYKVLNTEVVADAINLFVGDNEMSDGMIPSDLTFDGNHVHRPTDWNNYSNIYSTGTAAVNANGTCITLTGATESATWDDGGIYFALYDTGHIDASTPTPTVSRPITAVGSCNGAHSLTLSPAWPNDGAWSTSGLAYRITYWAGKVYAKNSKNMHEHKFSKRVSVRNSVYDNDWVGNQSTCIQLISTRAIDGINQDFLFENNHVRNCPSGIGMVSRPTVSINLAAGNGDTISANAGNGLVKICYAAGHTAATGSIAQIALVGGTTEANGTFSITVLSSTCFTIPVTFVNAWTSGGTAIIYHRGGPTKRVAIKNNLWENMGNGQNTASGLPFLNLQTAMKVTGGGTDETLISTDGDWSFDDLEISHNTVDGPASSPDNQSYFWKHLVYGGADFSYPSGVWPSRNWAIRDNILKQSAPSSGSSGFLFFNAAGSNTVAGLGNLIDTISDGSGAVTYNAFFSTGIGEAYEQARLSTYTNNGFVPDYTSIGFTARADNSISGYALTPLFTTGTCTTNATTTVTCSNSIPATVVKDTPFKVTGGAWRLVSSVSGTTITLQSAYPTSNSNSTFVLGYTGWSTTGADPGVNTSTLATAVSGVTN